MRNREAMRKPTKILESGKRASENLVLFLAGKQDRILS